MKRPGARQAPAVLLCGIAFFVGCSQPKPTAADRTTAVPTTAAPTAKAPVTWESVSTSLPGAIGLATAPADDRLYYHSPVSMMWQVALGSDWGEIPEEVYGTGTDGVRARFRHAGRQEIDYGCDGTRLAAAMFEGEHRPPEGSVYLTGLSAPEPVLLAQKAEETSADVRRWSLGKAGLTYEVRLRGEYKAEVRLRRGDVVLFSEVAERSFMDGEEPTPIDLSELYPIHMPFPHGAWALPQYGDDVAVVTVWTRSVEGGNLHTILIVGDSARRLEDPRFQGYFYACAF